MTTLSIHTDDIFADALRAYAQASGKSVNQTVKDLLAPILGLDHAPESDQTNPYMKLCGILRKNEENALQNVLAEQRTVDQELWQ